jgi:hypothetical protein
LSCPAFFVGGILKLVERGHKGMLLFSMPLYEVQDHEKDVWREISELELMDDLYKIYKKVTPAIKEMIMGKEIETPYGRYRLKLKGGEYGEKQSKLTTV